MKVQKIFSTTKGKSKKDKRIKYYYFVLLTFGPHPGNSKAINEDQSISFLHTNLQLLQGRFFVGLRREESSCGYALAWRLLAWASTLVSKKP